jgi:hypothetical protein
VLASQPTDHKFDGYEKSLHVLRGDGGVLEASGPEVIVSKLTKAREWLVCGAADYGRHFGSREFLRNNFNVTAIGAAIAVIDQIWINGKMTLPEVIRPLRFYVCQLGLG